jgi:hypothetical protein
LIDERGSRMPVIAESVDLADAVDAAGELLIAGSMLRLKLGHDPKQPFYD